VSRNYEMHRPPPADFRAFFDTGAKVQEMRRRWNVGWDALSRWFDETGTPRRVARIDAKPVPIDFMAVAPTLLKKDLIAHYGTHQTVVNRWLRETGAHTKSRWADDVKPPPPPRQRQVRPPITPRPAAPKTGRAEEAAQYLRRYTFVFRCHSGGCAAQNGLFWRYGNTVLTTAELIARAKRHGFNPDAWREIAA
jgi:choline dehydrogenase-like flavoprotein